ncbi:uncharacterized, partial [Tachysurus ichikawai]
PQFSCDVASHLPQGPRLQLKRQQILELVADGAVRSERTSAPDSVWCEV